MSKWAKIIKRFDLFFLFLALICSSLVFTLIYILFLDVAKVASESSTTSFKIAEIIMVATYFYWVSRAIWYMFKSHRRNNNE